MSHYVFVDVVLVRYRAIWERIILINVCYSRYVIRQLFYAFLDGICATAISWIKMHLWAQRQIKEYMYIIPWH